MTNPVLPDGPEIPPELGPRDDGPRRGQDDRPKLIGHGTDGSDGLIPGIHLRWAPPRKLGFPPAGVRLFRWQGSREHITCDGSLPGTRDVPPPGVPGILPGDWAEYFFYKLPRPADRVEVYLDLQAASDFYVVLHSGRSAYEPYHVFDLGPGARMLPFVDEGITSLIIFGRGIVVTMICHHSCNPPDDDTWHEIDLPHDGKLPAGLSAPDLASYYGVSDEDYAVALFRLLAGPADRPLTEDEWRDLGPVVEQVDKEDGATVPAGWSIPPDVETSGDPNSGIPALDVSSYDSLILTSIDPKIGRVLGIYGVDVTATAADLNSYLLVVSYPEDHLADLEHQHDFADVELYEILYSDLSLGRQVLFQDLFQPGIVEQPSTLFRAEKGLSYRNDPLRQTRILFAGPVREAQLFVAFTGSLRVEARRRSDPPTDFPLSRTYTGPEAIVKLSGELIEEVRLDGTDIVVYRVHHDAEKLSGIELRSTVCGLMVEPPLPIPRPERLRAMELPAVPTYEVATSGTEIVKTLKDNYLAGLRWLIYRHEGLLQIPQAPMAYHVERDDSGSFVRLTDDGPTVVTYPSTEAYDPPAGWPDRRPFYLDGLSALGTHDYRVLSVDLFGRESAPSDPASVTIAPPTPPAPIHVHAKYLDVTAVDATGNSSDPSLTRDEIDWLLAHGVSAICVDWQWTPSQDALCSEVDFFTVHFEHGWLNVFRGTVTSAPASDTLMASDLALTEDETRRYPALDGVSSFATFRIDVDLGKSIVADGFRLSWLKQGGKSFLVLRNTSGTTPRLWLLVPDTLAYAEPEDGKAFVISLQARSSALVDYRDAASWTDTSVTDTVSFANPESDVDGFKTYRTCIASPAFPDPPFVANEPQPMRYAQIAVSATNTAGVRGAASAPAPIFAVHRGPPDPLDPSFIDYGTASATAPDVHGKSTFYYRWQKQGSGVKYFVYRAVDQSVILADLAAGHRKGDYEALADSYSIAYGPGTFVLNDADDYAALDSNQLFVVANMAGNESAFARLHEKPIDESDPAYENRNTETPAIGDPEPPVAGNRLLFVDDTLDGRGDNVYFYRIRTVDVAGNLSALSETTIPVTIPQVLPPVRPAIASIQAGENQVYLSWAQKSHPAILGHQVYRTDDASRAGDWRRMSHLKTDPADAYSVPAGAALEFTDATALARQPYYYGVVAVIEDDDGNTVRSEMSPVRTCQAWDTTPPEAPAWDETASAWVYVDDAGDVFEWDDDLSSAVNPVAAVRLVWDVSDETRTYQVQRRLLTAGSWTTLLAWATGDGHASDQRFLLDREADPLLAYHYRIAARSAAELISDEPNDLQMDPPE